MRPAAILLFVTAAFMFASELIVNGQQTGAARSNIPLIATIFIAIGLLRPQGFMNMSNNAYRIWAIVRAIATPIWVSIEGVNAQEAGAYIYAGLEALIAAGLLTLLLGPPPSARRIALGMTLSVLGFVGAAILIGYAIR